MEPFDPFVSKHSRYKYVRPLVVACRACGAEGPLPQLNRDPEVVHDPGCLVWQFENAPDRVRKED